MASVVGYIRISKEEQGSRSLETQEQALRLWSQARGHDLVAIYRDDGVSGSVAPARREGAAQAIAHAKRKGVDLLVVAKLDRIARDLVATLDLVDNVLGSRAALASVAEDFDASTAAGRMFLQMMGMAAEFERNRIRERTCEGLATVRRQGRKTGGSVPFGYRSEAGVLVAVAEEQMTLARAFDLRAAGQSIRATAAMLNAEGMTRRESRPWNAHTLHRVLTAETRRRASLAEAA